MRFSAPILAFICLSISSGVVIAQADMQATNDFPNPYQIYTGFFNIPAGREWGATSLLILIQTANRSGSQSDAVLTQFVRLTRYVAAPSLIFPWC